MCSSVQSAFTVSGVSIKQLNSLFTFATSAAWSPGERFLWIIPKPPIFANAIAIRCSVTVSIAAPTIGIFNSKGLKCSEPLVKIVFKFVSWGWTSEYLGKSVTSSKVSEMPCSSANSSTFLGFIMGYL